MTENFLEKKFNNLEGWLATFESLNKSTNVLKKNRPPKKLEILQTKPSEFTEYLSLLHPELMLWGMALEALFKYHRLKRGIKLYQNGRYSWVRDHRLTQMAKDEGLWTKSTYEQKNTLKHLGNHVSWMGSS